MEKPNLNSTEFVKVESIDPVEIMNEEDEKEFVQQMKIDEQGSIVKDEEEDKAYLETYGTKEMIRDMITSDLTTLETFEIYNMCGKYLKDLIGWIPISGMDAPYFREKLIAYEKGDYKKSDSAAQNWYDDDYFKAKSKETKETIVQDDFRDVSNLAHRIKIKLPPSVLVKIYYMMVEKPRLEWSAYLTYNDVLPKIEDLIRGKMNEKKQNIIIDVKDMLFIPQHVGGGHVEGLELEYPEFMQDIYKVQSKGIKTTGRIHSHNTMGAFHSGTDDGEFKKNLEIDQSFFSIVVSMKGINYDKIPFKEVERTQENILNIMNKKMTYHVKVGKPYHNEKIKYGVTMLAELDTIAIPKKQFKKNLVDAYKFVNKYNTMMDVIDKTKNSFHLIEYFKEKEFLDYSNAREIRDLIIDNPTMLKVFNLYTKSITTVNQKNKRVEQERKDILKNLTGFADSMGYKLEDKLTESKVPHRPSTSQLNNMQKKSHSMITSNNPKRVRLIQGSQSKKHVEYTVTSNLIQYNRTHQCPVCKSENEIVFNRTEDYTHTFVCYQNNCHFEWMFKVI